MATLTATGTLVPTRAVLARFYQPQPVVTIGTTLLMGSADSTIVLNALCIWDASRVAADLDTVITQTVQLEQGFGIGFAALSGDQGDVGSEVSGGTFAVPNFTYSSPVKQTATITATATLTQAVGGPVVQKHPHDAGVAVLQNALITGDVSATTTVLGSGINIIYVAMAGSMTAADYVTKTGADSAPAGLTNLPPAFVSTSVHSDNEASITTTTKLRGTLRVTVWPGAVSSSSISSFDADSDAP